MPYEFNPTIQAGMDAHIPEETILVEVLLEGTPLYWSDRGTINWDSKTWLPVGLDLDDNFTERGGSLKIRNDNNTGSSLVLNNTLRDVELRIYLYYNGDAKEVFRGYFGDMELDPEYATLHFESHRAANTLAPRKRIAAPIFTNLPRLGERIKWGGDTLEVTF